MKLVVFIIDDHQFAIPIQHCERIIHMVEIQPLPLSPGHICGTINYHGEILPVINIRKLFKIRQRQFDLSDQIIIARTETTVVAIWADHTGEIVERDDEEIMNTGKIKLEVGYLSGLFKLDDGVVLIQDIDKFLTDKEIVKLDEAIKKQKLNIKKRSSDQQIKSKT